MWKYLDDLFIIVCDLKLYKATFVSNTILLSQKLEQIKHHIESNVLFSFTLETYPVPY